MTDHELVRADDGFPVATRFFAPPGSPRAAVLIAGGTGIPQRFYRAYAEHLAAHGFLVATLDYRGIGASRARVRTGMGQWALDADAVLRALHARTDAPVFHVGHSFGGQALGLMPSAARPRPIRGRPGLSGAILVAAQSGFYGHWPMPSRLRMAALWHGVVPGLVRAFDRLPSWAGLGEELPPQVARDWAEWCRTPGYLRTRIPAEKQYFHELLAPMLAFAFTDDDYAPGRSVDELLAWYMNADVEKRVIRPSSVGLRAIGHHGFFRRTSGELWRQSVDWIEARLADGVTTRAA